MATPQRCSLLGIPSELRLEIYDHIVSTTVELKVVRSDYRNIRLVCRELKEEFDDEMVKAIANFVAAVVQQSSPHEKCRLQIEKPRTYVESQHLKINISRDFLCSQVRGWCFNAIRPLADLLSGFHHAHSISMDVECHGITRDANWPAFSRLSELIFFTEMLRDQRLDRIGKLGKDDMQRDRQMLELTGGESLPHIVETIIDDLDFKPFWKIAEWRTKQQDGTAVQCLIWKI
ncbi:hypothetical protein K491DRAFT_722826 [Lophiostoma macrostomum CBS 122681]|uniref:Uncharacterized protein n=1 Tax=Lophiostoma macrostomum CBS 122681 TaxID=1314788 RepID=A0A6A6SNF6_9PLEO|nr:hypothetical protein K491DRAFT_722826 [Lophiostoma macrostomum CBS 122681]